MERTLTESRHRITITRRRVKKPAVMNNKFRYLLKKKHKTFYIESEYTTEFDASFRAIAQTKQDELRTKCSC